MNNLSILWDHLVERLNTPINKYRLELNKQSQVFSTSVEEAKREIIAQLAYKDFVELNKDDKKKIGDIARKIVRDLYNVIYKEVRGTTAANDAVNWTFYPGSSDKAFAVLIEARDPKNNPFDFFKRKRVVPIIKTHIDEMRQPGFLSNVGGIQSGEISTQLDAGKFIQMGHITSVANTLGKDVARQAASLLGKVGNHTTSELRLLELAKDAFPNGIHERTVAIRIEFEHASGNAGKGKTVDTEFIKKVKDVIDKIIAEKRDWSQTEGSDTTIEIVEKQILAAAMKAGAISKLSTKINKTKFKREKKWDLTAKRKKPKIQTVKLPAIGVLQRAQESEYNVAKLLSLINAKLPQTVQNLMGAGNLVNRTGRLAESAEVVSITETQKGFPSIAYTYKRSPYDVFDPVLGKSPWNIPQRDPKNLITKAVREAARGLALGRYGVRRV